MDNLALPASRQKWRLKSRPAGHLLHDYASCVCVHVNIMGEIRRLPTSCEADQRPGLNESRTYTASTTDKIFFYLLRN